jgi:hypothetical protein
MDLGLFARVLWRFRLLAVCGFIAALLLAMLTYTTIELDGGLPTIGRPREGMAE